MIAIMYLKIDCLFYLLFAGAFAGAFSAAIAMELNKRNAQTHKPLHNILNFWFIFFSGLLTN